MSEEPELFKLDEEQDDAAQPPIPVSHAPSSQPSSPVSMADLNLQPNPVFDYYQMRMHLRLDETTREWLAEQEAAIAHNSDHAFRVGAIPLFNVIAEFKYWQRQPDFAEAVAAIRALAGLIRASTAKNMKELETELKKASDTLKDLSHKIWAIGGLVDLAGRCDLFVRYLTRTSTLEYEDFNSAKPHLLDRAEKFVKISCNAHRAIAMLCQDFITDRSTILIHGFSRVVLKVLKIAAQNKKLFRVFCTEGRPDRTGIQLSRELAELGVRVKLLLDSAVAFRMGDIDMVLVGADGVVANGGIINMMGTYQIALIAHSMNKPVYVAAESYKFAKLYPLNQKDVEQTQLDIDFGVPIPPRVEVEISARDYTPPQYLTQLFTDLGVFSPEAISNEHFQLYL